MSKTSRRVSLVILIAIPVVHVISVLIASMNTPGYVTRLEPISNLANSTSPFRYLAIWGGLIFPGAALAGVSICVKRAHLFGRLGEAGLTLAALSGMGMVLSGAFDYDSGFHTIFVVASACLSAPAIMLIALDHPAWSNRPVYKALACLWAPFPLADVSARTYAVMHGRHLHYYAGIQQRILVGVTLCLFSFVIWTAIKWWRNNNQVNMTGARTTMGSAPET